MNVTRGSDQLERLVDLRQQEGEEAEVRRRDLLHRAALKNYDDNRADSGCDGGF
jgi:hypothetical protein